MAYYSFYWLENYKKLAAPSGHPGDFKSNPAGKDIEWMRDKKLRYAGTHRKSNGKEGHIWAAPTGMVYYYEDLKDLDSGGSGEGGGSGSASAGNDNPFGYGTPNFNPFNFPGLQSNPFSATSDPIDPRIGLPQSFGMQPASGGAAARTGSANTAGNNLLNSMRQQQAGNRAAMNAFSAPGGIADTSIATSSIGVVTSPVALGSMPVVTHPYDSSESTIKKDDHTEEDDKDGCTSKFYILDKSGKELDSEARFFFNIMNPLAGGIFELCEKAKKAKNKGKVVLKKGSSVDQVSPSKTVSKILAETIDEAIKGGRKFSHFPFGQRVKFKILPQTDPDCWNVAFDDYSRAYVDAYDFDALSGELQTPAEIGTHEEPLSYNVIQAGFIGHAICERYSLPLYGIIRHTKNKLTPSPLRPYNLTHPKGLIKECEIVQEMTGDNTELEQAEPVGDKYDPLLKIYYIKKGSKINKNTNLPEERPYYLCVLRRMKTGKEKDKVGNEHNVYSFNQYTGCKFVKVT